MRGSDCSPAVRVVARPEALARLRWPTGAEVVVLAPDEVLALGATALDVEDPAAIVEAEEGFWVVEMDRDELVAWVAGNATWPLPDTDSYFVQGVVAGIPVKILMTGRRARVLTRRTLSHDLEARL